MFSQKGENTFTIVSFGDSITAPRAGVVTYSDLLRQELKPKNGKLLDVVNAGIGGNTTQHARERFEKDVLSRKPDLVIMQFGSNDAAVDVWKNPPADRPRVSLEDYEKNLEWMITKIQEQKGKVILVTPPPSRWTEKLKEMYGKPPYAPNDPNGFNYLKEKYIDKMKEVGARKKVSVIDLYSRYFEFEKAEKRPMDELYVDGLHPNSEGHRIEADMLLDTIRKMKLGIR